MEELDMKVLLRGNGKIITVKRTHEINRVLGVVTFYSLEGTPITVAHDMYDIIEIKNRGL